MADVIKIGVYGGMVQWVTNTPKGVEVQIFDYDTDNIEVELLSKDDDGYSCVIATYTSS